MNFSFLLSSFLLKIPLIIVCSLLSISIPSYSEASEQHLFNKPVVGLDVAQIILLKATNHNASGQQTHVDHIRDIFSKRMGELGYATKTDANLKFDVTVALNCKEQVTQTRPTDHSKKLSRLEYVGHGPPCSFQYQFRGEPIPWQRIDRLIYAEAVKVTKTLDFPSQGLSPSSRIEAFLKEYDFPLLLAAEWTHIDRLIKIFHASETTHLRQQFIISLLGEIHATQAFSFLVNTLKEHHLTAESARALGHFGEQARTHLLELLQTSHRSEVQAAAAYGLGLVGALTGNTSSTPHLLKILTTPGVDLRIQTEVVWALGKAPDFSAFQTLSKLEERIWQMPSQDPELLKLHKAVDWSIREVRQGGHTDDY